MSDFFAAFAGFKPDPSAPAQEEFARLARHRNWKPDGKTWRRQWRKFVVAEFTKHYGSQEGKLAGWQALCEEVGVKEPIEKLNSITKCTKVLKKVHVNIVDLIDIRRANTNANFEDKKLLVKDNSIKKFPHVGALRRYTKATGKIFPKEAAKEDGFLKVLLRHIF